MKNGHLCWDSTGNGDPVDVVANTTFIEALMHLPIHTLDTHQLSVRQLFRNLSPRSLISIQTYREAHSDFDRFLSRLEREYADIAHPETGQWPDDVCTGPEVLDSVFVDLSPLIRMDTLLDGRRYVLVDTMVGHKYFTFPEFEDYYGVTVLSLLTSLSEVRFQRIKRALAIARVEAPVQFEVTVMSEHGVAAESITAYTIDQVQSYMWHNNKQIISITEGCPT